MPLRPARRSCPRSAGVDQFKTPDLGSEIEISLRPVKPASGSTCFPRDEFGSLDFVARAPTVEADPFRCASSRVVQVDASPP
jgi:hypothetical protein